LFHTQYFSMASIPFLLFDLDGTLINSMGDIHIAANLLRAEHGMPAMDVEVLRPCIGRGVAFLVSGVLSAPETAAEASPRAIERYRELYALHALDTTAPYDGVQEVLDALQNIPMAVISNKPERATKEILTALDLAKYFRHIAGGDSFEEMKPSPLPLRHIMAAEGASADRTWMIGDSVYDIEAGKGAGVRTVAVTWGFQDAEKLKALEPDHMVSAFKDICKLFC
jgi:phosphoglycolate phosphatase